MKVLYDITVLGMGQIDNTARTGIYRVIENIAKQLAKRNDIDILFSCPPTLSHTEACFKYFDAKPEIDRSLFTTKLTIRRTVSAKMNRDKLIGTVGQEQGSFINLLSTKFSIRGYHSLFQLNKLFLQEREFDMNQFNETDIYHSTFYALPNHLHSSSKKLFLTSYDIIPLLYPQYARPEVVAMIKGVVESIKPDTWVLCISEATRTDLLNYLGDKADPRKVIVTELAASENFYPSHNPVLNAQVRKKYNIPEAPYLLSVCTLEPRKNIDQVIRAFVRFCQQEHNTDLNLVLVGTKGWMFDKIFEELEASSSLKSRIIITGFVDDADLASIYTDALAFVYPSFYEGFGLPPLEAMKCGVPVITSNTSSLPEVVGDAGIMVDPTDLDGLCHAMATVVRDETLRANMQKQSLARAGMFSWEKCADKTVQAYKLAVNS